MKLDLIIAGVPKGADYWGPEEDSNYFGSYYTGPKKYNDRFLVEVRKNKEGVFSYFTMFKFNTYDEESRAGGFFAISIRMDVICKRVDLFYNYLHLLYNKYVVGSILKDDAAGVRYLTSSFKMKDSELNTIQNSIINFLQSSLVGSDFATLDTSLEKGQDVFEINVADANWDYVSQILKKRSGFYISEQPETIREKTLREISEKKIENIVDSKNAEIALLNSDLDNCRKQIEEATLKYEHYISQSDDAVKKAQINAERVKELEAELRIYQKKTDFSAATAEIKKPLLVLAEYAKQNKEEKREDNNELNSIKILIICIFVVSFLVLGLIAFMAFTLL